MDAQNEFRRDVLVSVRPIYASKILEGKKTVELRRRFSANGVGSIVIIYSSSPVRAIVGYARIKDVQKLPVATIWKHHGSHACIAKKEFDAYFSGLNIGFAILLESVIALKAHFKASDLEEHFGIVAPQSYRYVPNSCFAMLSDEQRFQDSDRHEHRDRTGRPAAGSSVAR
jgi:predicted transcriptional regulator